MTPRARTRWRPALAAATIAWLLAASGAIAQPGSPSLEGLDGGRLTTSDLATGWHVFIVWASWSPRCRDVVERANAIEAEWGDKARVHLVNFQESSEEVRRFLAGKGARPQVYLDRDGSFSKKHTVTTLPGLLVVGDGKTAFRGKLPPDPDPVLGQFLR